MPNVVDQSALWNALLTSTIITWFGGTATYITMISFNKAFLQILTGKIALKGR